MIVPQWTESNQLVATTDGAHRVTVNGVNVFRRLHLRCHRVMNHFDSLDTLKTDGPEICKRQLRLVKMKNQMQANGAME